MTRPSDTRMRAAKILGVDPTNLSEEKAQAILEKNHVPKENIRLGIPRQPTKHKE